MADYNVLPRAVVSHKPTSDWNNLRFARTTDRHK